MERLINFLDQNPHISYSTPSSSDFNTLRPGYVIDSTTPAIILRPRTADDVACLISILKTNSLRFAIRVGGHDMFGRYQAESAVTIDLREIAYIHVDREARTARIGGGVIVSDLLSVLDQYGMVVPHPIISSVGFVGWATHGGYGLMSSEYGLGVDQILQAKVVGADATVCNANDEMLAVIRGGGGTLGVIVELTIKIYPLAQVMRTPSDLDPVLIVMTVARRIHTIRFQRPPRGDQAIQRCVSSAESYTPEGIESLPVHYERPRWEGIWGNLCLGILRP